MKLDATVLRTMNVPDFRVLEAVEKGMKDHALVPLALIASLANLRHGGVHKIISSLLRDKLLSHERKQKGGGYDGYRVTNAGYDILALHTLKTLKQIAALGPKIGTGKESDIYLGVSPDGQQVVLKFHRLGRTSFRAVKKKRDYFGPKAMQQAAHSWLFLSKLSALKEYAFMKALHDVQYPTPTPLAQNRHVVVMNLIRGVPLYQVQSKELTVEQAQDIYQQALGLAKRLAQQHGLVHCDLNEFNLMVDLSGIQQLAAAADDPYARHSGLDSVAASTKRSHGVSLGPLSKPAWEQSLEAQDNLHDIPEPVARLSNGQAKPIVTLIDFPQMISTQHANAQELYERDLQCLQRFFALKLQCQIPEEAHAGTSWEEIMGETPQDDRLDLDLRASGFNNQFQTGLELYYFDSQINQPESSREMGVVTEGDEEEEEDESESHYDEEDEESDQDEVEEKDVTKEAASTVVEYHGELNLEEDQDPESSHKNDNDLQSMASSRKSTRSYISGTSQMTDLDRERLTAQVKNRVKKQVEEQKRRAKTSGAYRASRNKNKQYVKGKRVLKEALV
mmetsp:Transcript_18577/g.38378  ORF Transcript_18577/g.38378 Transcript_18577/m.38378 type:complete len:563 (-) Transcript_18577:35-1723(-)